MWRVVCVDASLQFAWCCVVLLVEYAAPLGMLGLIGYIGDAAPGEPVPPKSIAFGAAIALGPLLLNVCHGQANASGWRFGVKLRAYITRAVCEKALRFDASATDQSVGQMTNLLAVDVQNIVQFAGFAAWLWLEGMQLVCTLGALFWILGPAALGGLAVCLFAFPVNAIVMRRVKLLQERLMTQKDRRMALITEVVNAIRAIKLHAWESEFEDRIADERKREVATLLTFQRFNAVTSTLWLTQPTIAGLASFLLATRALPPYRLTAAQGFTSLTLFQLLSVSLTFLPYVINSAIQANVGLKRISRFLSLDDVDGRDDGAGLGLECGAVVVRSASFAWKSPPPDDKATASGAKQKQKKRGAKGCGKSSLLNALLGDIPRVSGRAALAGRVSYCPQRAWLANASLRDNITFGSPFVPLKYEAVLDACALRADLELLPAGDATEIGEKGINLSGGQQQRVNLARACYADSDIVILDDVLSAVDAHVGAHLFEQCILGLLANRTRVLVTHSTALAFSRASHVVVMDKGRVLASGPPTSAAPEIQALASQAISNPSSRVSSRGSSRVGSTIDLTALPPNGTGNTRAAARPSERPPPAADGDGRAKPSASGAIVQEEERAKGAAKLSTYLLYLRAAGGLPFAVAFCALLCMYSSMNPLQSIALKSWMASMEGSHPRSPASTTACLVYSATAMGLIIVTLCRNIVLPSASVAASRKLHGGMMRSVLHAPISWYDATPLGRILNRFSSDIAAIDQQVASQFKDVVVFTFNVLAIALVCSLGTGHAVATATVLGAVGCATFFSWLVYSVYRVAAREQKRLESVTKSPLLAFFGELVSGAAVARAFGDSDVRRLVRTADSKVDDANRALYYLQAQTNQWLKVSMNLIGSLVTSAVVITVIWQRDKLGSGDAGLTLSYSTQFVGAISALLNLRTVLEISMNDVERIGEYTNDLPTEAYDTPSAPAHTGPAASVTTATATAITPARLPPQWPADGAIELKAVRLQYATASTPVFRALSFSIPARTRVGVCGRTGAGKSSLAVALFRTVELSGGAITIDGVDTRHVPLQRLRGALSIIQQEPTLFQGSVRYNMAPVSEHTDDELWEALRRAGLEAKVASMPKGLDADVAEAGGNLSAGERQLLCMARAMLRRRPVLVMDEATASVDHATDGRIQEMIKRDFRGNTTVLTIAHRLHTIAFYDRILLLGGGEVVEYDTPLQLLSTQGGSLRKLAEESGDLQGLMAAASES